MDAISAPASAVNSNNALQHASLLVASTVLQNGDGQQYDAADQVQPHRVAPRRQRDVCRHWARGYCNRGTLCGFFHTGPSPNPDLCRKTATELEEAYVTVKCTVPCKDFQVGKCNRGEKCKFAHADLRPRYPFTDKSYVSDMYTMPQLAAYSYDIMPQGQMPPPQYYNDIPQGYPPSQMSVSQTPCAIQAAAPCGVRYPTVIQHCPYG